LAVAIGAEDVVVEMTGYKVGGFLLSRAKGTNLIATINLVLLYLRRWQ